MRVQELQGALQSGKLPHAMMLFGSATYMIDLWIEKIARHYSAHDEPFRLYHHEYTFNAAKAHLSQNSLFGGANILVIKSDKKIPKKDLDALIEMTEKSDENFLIYAYYGDDFSQSNKSFLKKNVTDNVRLFEPFFGEAVAMLKQECAEKGLMIEPNTLIYLYKSLDENLALSMNEIDKLRILNRPVHTKDIDALVYSMAEVKLDDIICDILDKKDFLANLTTLLESGADPIDILANFSTYVSQLVLFLSYIKLNGSLNVKMILGYNPPPQIIKRKEAQAMRFNFSLFQQMLQLLLDAELEMKQQSKADKQAQLFATLLRFQTLL